MNAEPLLLALFHLLREALRTDAHFRVELGVQGGKLDTVMPSDRRDLAHPGRIVRYLLTDDNNPERTTREEVGLLLAFDRCPFASVLLLLAFHHLPIPCDLAIRQCLRQFLHVIGREVFASEFELPQVF